MEEIQSPHILIVDDDTALLSALPHMIALRIHGVNVDTADTAQQALDLVKVHTYDAIVSDIKMPGMDGLELLSRIQEQRPEVPTLLITGHAEQDSIVQALRAGAYDFIFKPIDRVYFVAALHRAVQTCQLRRQVQEQQYALKEYASLLEQQVAQRTRELSAANIAMQRLLHDLLDAARIEAHQLVLHRAPHNLTQLCRHLLTEDILTQTSSPNMIYVEEALEVEVDAERFQRALLHLLLHACAAAPKESQVTLTLQSTEQDIQILIGPLAPDLTEETEALLFEPFYRFSDHEMLEGALPGVGLGLFVARQIIEQHEGRVYVQRSPEGDSLFVVILHRLLSSLEEEEHNEVHEPTPFSPPQWLVS